METTRRATLLEVWGTPTFAGTAGIHQVHSRKPSCAVSEDVPNRDGALQFYFVTDQAAPCFFSNSAAAVTATHPIATLSVGTSVSFSARLRNLWNCDLWLRVRVRDPVVGRGTTDCCCILCYGWEDFFRGLHGVRLRASFVGERRMSGRAVCRVAGIRKSAGQARGIVASEPRAIPAGSRASILRFAAAPE